MKFCPLSPLLLILAATPAWSKPERTEVPFDPQPGVYDLGNDRFILATVVTNDGRTTSVGSLFRDGLPIAGGEYYRLEIPLGSFIWYPANSDTGSFGWTRINPEQKHSRWSMAVVEVKPAPDAKLLRTSLRDPIPPVARPALPPAQPCPPRNQ